MDGKGVALGYFFGPRIDSLHGLDKIYSFNSGDAIRVCMFGDRGILKKHWPVVGRVAPWNPAEWPVPMFCRHGNVRVSYDPESLVVLKEERYDMQQCAKLPEDGLDGSGFVEIKLTRQLASTS